MCETAAEALEFKRGWRSLDDYSSIVQKKIDSMYRSFSSTTQASFDRYVQQCSKMTHHVQIRLDV